MLTVRFLKKCAMLYDINKEYWLFHCFIFKMQRLTCEFIIGS